MATNRPPVLPMRHQLHGRASQKPAACFMPFLGKPIQLSEHEARE
ncbi:hypothetical protein COLO4_00516 [Corchorus olitorius]|uniref:Uncharacterized protein n=1 Tax=Corchorus olitorius TaxID=93759 RepID=A0A1R3L3W3_9ROSI|nr:hypothetical protein COLO4_00516 [Corchorus olitorius]